LYDEHEWRAGASSALVRAAPPQIALLHEPSGTLLAADVVAYGKGLTGTSAAALRMAPGPATANMTQARHVLRMQRVRRGCLPPARRGGPGAQARLDAERLAALPFTRLFPSHDAGAGENAERAGAPAGLSPARAVTAARDAPVDLDTACAVITARES